MRETMVANESVINVYVHLAVGHDAEEWKRGWERGSLLGINDPSPYGYARATEMGCRVTFSKPGGDTRLLKYLRLALRLILGFDYLHAAANKDQILRSDVIWTHTESQFLAVAAILAHARSGTHRPRLIGQSVWLFDRWPKLWLPYRWHYTRLIREVDILTVLSPDNAAIARRLFPDKKVEFVRFGIPNEYIEPVAERPITPMRVLCLGNDRDRDWDCAIKALANQDDIELTILSSTAKRSLASNKRNVTLARVAKNDELLSFLRQASVMLVPLTKNFHASGITVLQEAALFGLPIIASDTGGLRAYFDDGAVRYVPLNSPEDILREVRRAAADPHAMRQLATRAQRRMISPDMGCNAYIRRHVEMSRNLLASEERA